MQSKCFVEISSEWAVFGQIFFFFPRTRSILLGRSFSYFTGPGRYIFFYGLGCTFRNRPIKFFYGLDQDRAEILTFITSRVSIFLYDSGHAEFVFWVRPALGFRPIQTFYSLLLLYDHFDIAVSCKTVPIKFQLDRHFLKSRYSVENVVRCLLTWITISLFLCLYLK